MAVEGRQKIAETDAVAAGTGLSQELVHRPQTHPHVCLTLSISVESDLLVDDVFIAAALEETI